jgi:hypothetical protein
VGDSSHRHDQAAEVNLTMEIINVESRSDVDVSYHPKPTLQGESQGPAMMAGHPAIGDCDF